MHHLKMELSDYYMSKDHFIVEDLFDFNNDEAGLDGGDDSGAFEAVNGSSTDSSTVTGNSNGHGSSASGYGQHFPTTDFCQPCEEVAELEWLSNFVEDCFSSKDYQTLQFSNININSSDQAQQAGGSSVPAKARSKRSRANPSNWASRIPILPAPAAQHAPAEARIPMAGGSGGMRRCLHCGSDKTPQWRMGPMGPKTLCNACGVRYKSGRLVPEYRPAASPTFVVTEHSNSHRKVVELRKQKEMEEEEQQSFWS